VVSPDVGGVVRRSGDGEAPGVRLAIIDKRPAPAERVGVMNVIGDVEGAQLRHHGRQVDTANTLVKAAQAAEAGGATRVVATARNRCSRRCGERIAESEIDELV